MAQPAEATLDVVRGAGGQGGRETSDLSPVCRLIVSALPHAAMPPSVYHARMAPHHPASSASSAAAVAVAHALARRSLSVNHTQAVTLGVMVAYIAVIALLWNLPYVRYVLWPFKVRRPVALSLLLSVSLSRDRVM